MNKTETDLNLIADCQDMDYPAAHSMDTTWFAVDKDGYIAVMESNEEGPVPLSVVDYQSELLEELAESLDKKLLKDENRVPVPASIGLYSYSSLFDDFPGLDKSNPEEEEKASEMSENGVAFPYRRTGRFEDDEFRSSQTNPFQTNPFQTNPLRFDSVSPKMQAKLKPYFMENIRFSETEWIQPALETECQFWNLNVDNPQAIDTAGRVVPIPQSLLAPPYQKPQSAGRQQKDSSDTDKPWWKKLFGG